MPRSAGFSTPKYRKHRASGQAVVTIAGRDHYLGPYGTKGSRVEYDRLIGEWLAAGRPTTITTQADLTVVELCRAYKRFAESYYQRGGMLDNIATAMRGLRLRYGNTLAVDFGPLALKAVRQQFVEDGKARTYCNRLTDMIRRTFRWAASEELIPMQTWQALTTVAGLRRGHTEARETVPVSPVDETTVEATLAFLPATVADMVRLQRLTGMRPGEVCRLRPCDVDRSGKVWRYSPAEHKTAHHGKRRTVFIGPKAQAILAPYLLRAADAHCFVPSESESARKALLRANRKSKVQPSQVDRRKRKAKRKPGSHYKPTAYYHAILRASDAADRAAHAADESIEPETRIVPRWSPNQLRHAAATDIRKLFGLEAAQVVLGHAKADVTMVYAERDMAKAEAVMQEVG